VGQARSKGSEYRQMAPELQEAFFIFIFCEKEAFFIYPQEKQEAFLF
jgi:hypothetical protein